MFTDTMYSQILCIHRYYVFTDFIVLTDTTYLQITRIHIYSHIPFVYRLHVFTDSMTLTDTIYLRITCIHKYHLFTDYMFIDIMY